MMTHAPAAAGVGTRACWTQARKLAPMLGPSKIHAGRAVIRSVTQRFGNDVVVFTVAMGNCRHRRPIRERGRASGQHPLAGPGRDRPEAEPRPCGSPRPPMFDPPQVGFDRQAALVRQIARLLVRQAGSRRPRRLGRWLARRAWAVFFCDSAAEPEARPAKRRALIAATSAASKGQSSSMVIHLMAISPPSLSRAPEWIAMVGASFDFFERFLRHLLEL